MNEINDNVALVTGAARRIGRVIAEGLARDGWAVAVHYNTSTEEAIETVNHIEEANGKAVAFQADLADEGQVADLVPAVVSELGKVTCLINNASIFEEDTVASATRKSWNAHVEVNLKAQFFLMQAMVANIGDDQKGNVINLIDQRVHNLTPYFTSYTLSKAGLWTLTQTSAQSLAPHIRVNAIGPGPTLASSRQSEEHFNRQWQATPLKISVDPQEIYNAVRFILATPSMTGQMLTLDAGQHLGWSQPGQSTPSTE